MKNRVSIFKRLIRNIGFLYLLLLGISGEASAQTTLAAGDIAFVGYNMADNSGTVRDSFAFMPLVALASGTEIFFTDFGWSSDGGGKIATGCRVLGTSGAVSDGMIKWTASESIAVGAIVWVTCKNAPLVSNRGTVAGVIASTNSSSEYVNLVTGGDQILAFQGTTASPTLIAAIAMHKTSWDATYAECEFASGKSLLPPALASNNCTFLPGTTTRNGHFNCVALSGTPAEKRAIIYNTSNWTFDPILIPGTTFGPFVSYCLATAAVSSPSVTVTATTNVSCNGGSNGSATVTATGGTTPYTYAWSGGGSGATKTGLSAGTYTCTVTDGASMTATVTATITQPAVVTVSGSNTMCATTTLTTTGSGGTWSSSNTSVATVASTGVVSGVSAGTVVISYSHSCGTATKGVTVNLANPGTISGTADVCSGSTTSLSATGSSGGVWSSSNTAVGTVNSSSGVVAGVGAGTTTISYSVTSGCGTAAATRVVTVNSAPSAGTMNGATTVCEGVSTAFTLQAITRLFVLNPVAIAGEKSVGIASFGGTYGITNQSLKAPPSDNTLGCSSFPADYFAGKVALIPRGTCAFVVKVKNAQNAGAIACIISNNFTSAIPPSLGGTDVTITIPAFSVTNADGIAMTGQLTLSEDVRVSVNTEEITAGTWSSSNTGVATVGSAGSVTGAGGGTALISYAATNDCGTAYASKEITVNPTPMAGTISGTTTVTVSSTATLSASGFSGGVWSSTNTSVATVGSTGVVTGVSTGTATISYLVSNGCGTSVATVNVTVISSFSAIVTAQTNVACNGGNTGSLTVTPSGGTPGYTYLWSNGSTGATNTGLIAGVYTCTVADAASGTATVSATITQPTAIAVTAASQTNISCFGGTNGAASINTPTGGAVGYSYDWTPGTPTGDGTTSVSGLAAGTYTCTVTDANGCTAGQSFTITAPSTLVVSSSSQTNLTCFGGSNGAASASVSGGTTSYTYNWTPGNPTGDGTSSVTGLTAGSWTCTVTDANACTTTQTFNITSPSALVVTPVSQTNVSCNGGTTGAASVSVSGGVTAYTYNWTPGTPTGDGTTSVTGLTAGSWTCTVTDANSCSAQQTFNITQPPVLAVTAASQTNVACFGGNSGAATVNTPTGGAGSYTYNWTPGNPTGDGTVSVSGLTAGSWTCTVTDANSCTAMQTFTITSPSSLVVTPASQTNVSCFGANNGAATINTATGGAGGYTYDWTPGTPTGDGTVSVSGLTAGTWTCTVTDANACTAMQQFTITAPTPFVVTPASQTNVLCNGGSDGAASINTPTGGAGGYTYNWTPGNPTGDGTVSVTGLTAGSWTCTVTDANSCVSSHTFTITEPPAVSGTITGSDNLCQSATTTLTISGMSGGVWSSTNTAAGSVNPTSGVVTGISGGTTTISYTVTDICGTAAATKIVTVTSLPGTISGTLAICEGTTTTLGNAASGGTWSSSNSGVASIDGTTGEVSGAGAGTAMISYSTGCGAPSTATMTINPIPAAISGTATICIGGTTTLSNSVSGGTWSSGTPAVATVHPTTGVVTGVSAGNSDISYIMGCASVKRIVTVNGGPAVAAVTGSSSVCEGATISLSDATADGTWSSSNTSVATVGSSGTVTGLSGGTAAISYIVTATCGSSYAVKIITVHSLPAPISGTASVCEGNTTALSTTPGGGTWSSSTAAASINAATGVVTGDNEGSTIISYQSPAGCYRTIEVTVNATPGTIVGSASTCVGTTTTLSAPPGGGTWSSSFPGKATVDVNSGVVTGVSAGTTIISYNLPFGCRSTAVVTVITTPATITGSLSLCGGSTSALSSATTGGTWSSSDAGVATINASTGVVTGISTGTTTISYTTGSCATSAVVTVGGTMTGSTGTALVCAGQAATLSNATSGGTWSSSNTAAATVHAATGLVTGVGAGTTNITYTLSGGCYSVTEVTVNAAMASITGSGTVCAGSTTPLSHADGGGVWSSSNTSRVTIDAGSGIMTGVAGGSATISYSLSAGCVTTRVITVNVLPNTIGGGGAAMCLGGGTTFSCTPSGGTWSSTTTGVATIGSTGVISSVSTGTSVISYTLGTGCASTRTITVLASPSAITGSATACIGSTTTLSSSPAGGTWTSSVPSKATVVAGTGVVTGVAAGNSTISYTLSTGCRRTIIATVVTLPGAIGGVLTLCSSCTTTLTSATFSGTWTSSNAGVATVNPTTGLVSGVGVGTSTISYTVGTGCSRTAVVTVGATPGPITGTHIVCVGQTNATLDHPVPVGTWSSSNTTVATVHAATGIFTGIGSGTATISYTISPGYFVTAVVTVDPAMATTTGNTSMCPGATMMLANTTPSGVWSSNSPLKASVDAGTGLVTALVTGTAAITYTVGVGCYRVSIVTANPVPNIMGSNTVANGGTTTLTGSPAGGVWASADAGVASVVAGTGLVTGVSLGATSMSYTIGAGCSGVRTITVVVPRPGMYGATGGEESSAQLLKVYPNPTSGTLTVEAPVAGRFNVYTIDGREVAQYAVTASANMVTLPSNLTAGIYMCRFVGADGTSAIVRLVYER